MSQRYALPKHSGKALCPGWTDLIVAEIEVRQRWVLDNLLHQHSWKSLVSEFIDQFHPST